jgi:hypothetical protein
MLTRLLTLMLLAGPAVAADAPVLLELFTSQGCSSCPPADRLLTELSRRDDVLALGFHVSYWNYIGWKDTFATDATTKRQYAYARPLGSASVYTPQMVVGGRAHTVGSDASEIERLVGHARKNAGQVTVAIEATGVSVGAGEGRGTVTLACYDARHEVKVARGENGGRVLGYSNVVRHLDSLGDWSGAPLRFAVDLEAQRAAGRDGCVALVQQPGPGAVIGVARFRLTERAAGR